MGRLALGSYIVGTTRTLPYELNPLLLDFLKVSSSFENLMKAALIFRKKYTYITNEYIICGPEDHRGLQGEGSDLTHLLYFITYPLLPNTLERYLGSVHDSFVTCVLSLACIIPPREVLAVYRWLLPLQSLLWPSGHTLVL